MARYINKRIATFALLAGLFALCSSFAVFAQIDSTQGISDTILSKFNCMHIRPESCALFSPFCAVNHSGKCSKVNPVLATFAVSSSIKPEETGTCSGNQCITLNFGKPLEHSIPLNITCTGSTAASNQFFIRYTGAGPLVKNPDVACGKAFKVPAMVGSLQLDVVPINDEVCEKQTSTSEKVKLTIDCTKSQSVYCVAGSVPTHTVTLNDAQDCKPKGEFWMGANSSYNWDVSNVVGTCTLGLKWLHKTRTSATTNEWKYTWKSKTITALKPKGTRSAAQISTDIVFTNTQTSITDYPSVVNLTCPGAWGSSIFFPQVTSSFDGSNDGGGGGDEPFVGGI